MGVIIQRMGGEESKRKEEFVSHLKEYPYHNKNNITEQEFVHDVFHMFDLSKPESYGGYLFVSGTHLLLLYYKYLLALVTMKHTQNKGTLSRKIAIQSIEEMHDNPKLAIECSYKLIQGENGNNITKDKFVDFVMNCFEKGVESINKESRCENTFKENLRQWTKKSHPVLMEHIEKVFQQNAQSVSNEWTQGDFKRWILNKKHWSLYIELKGVGYNIPLNIPCLLGVNVKSD